MEIRIQQLGDEHSLAYVRSQIDTFGAHADPAAFRISATGATAFGVLEGPELVAKAAYVQAVTNWNGQRLATATVRDVTVDAEWRGRKIGRRLLTTLLRDAHERGCVLATLYPSVPAVYRALDFEIVADRSLWRLPTAGLAVRRPPEGVTVRRATFEQAAEFHDRYVRAVDGALVRTAAMWDPALTHTVAVDVSGTRIGHASWRRAEDHLLVADLTAVRPEAYFALLGTLATWADLLPETRLWASAGDPLWLVLPGNPSEVVGHHRYMARILDVPRALAVRSWPVDGTAEIGVRDPLVEANTGRWRIQASGGAVEIRRVSSDPGVEALTARALTALFAGRPGADLAASGLGTVPDDVLRLFASGPTPRVFDGF
ncbi:enhanced intracellular survival protein Eis [Nonomuraea sp. NPDC059194]|uniref:GNAT family N-acetyltransferase n=1 Tax=Nonomuraea sp. NPDC059194 TaxID=3346764 RepID=UPI0036A56C51